MNNESKILEILYSMHDASTAMLKKLEEMDGRLINLEEDVSVMKSDISTMKSDISSIKKVQNIHSSKLDSISKTLVLSIEHQAALSARIDNLERKAM